jgi:hypothetical protein
MQRLAKDSKTLKLNNFTILSARAVCKQSAQKNIWTA